MQDENSVVQTGEKSKLAQTFDDNSQKSRESDEEVQQITEELDMKKGDSLAFVNGASQEDSQKKDDGSVTFVNLKGQRIKESKDGIQEVQSDTSETEDEFEVDDKNVAIEIPASRCSMFNLWRRFMDLTLHQFFRDITVVGKHNVPKKGPVIFCGNHSNQFVDGAILFFTSPRDARFMVAAKSMRRPCLKSMFGWAKSIPVERAGDLAKKGTGQISFDDVTSVRGHGTQFTKEFAIGDQLFTSTKSGMCKIEEQIVTEIVNDTELRLKEPGVASFTVDEQYDFKILPKVDQSQVFKSVEDVLGSGGTVAMFPEGGSHDRPDLLPFKAGIALMTFSTIVNTGQVPIIIPSGLKYFSREEFRSRVIVEFGRPYKPTKKMIDLYKGGEKRKAVTLMLKDLQDRMHEVTMTAPTYNEMQAVYMARNLYMPKNTTNLSDEDENQIYQRFFKGYNQNKDEPELKLLVDAITSYRIYLKLFNITDDQVKYFKGNYLYQVVLMLYSLVRLIFSLLFVIPGNCITFPLSIAINHYTEQERIKALKASTVKIRANDVQSSIKILAYIVTYPFYLGFFTFIFNRMMRNYFELNRVEAYSLSTIFYFLFPITSLIAIRSHDGVMTHFPEFHGRFVSLFYPDQIEAIKKVRKVLKAKVRHVVDAMGPKLFKNFDKMRLIMRGESADGGSPHRAREDVKSVDRNNGSHLSLSDLNQPIRRRHRTASSAKLNEKDFGKTQNSEQAKTETDYGLDYKDELELNLAFETFKDILD